MNLCLGHHQLAWQLFSQTYLGPRSKLFGHQYLIAKNYLQPIPCHEGPDIKGN